MPEESPVSSAGSKSELKPLIRKARPSDVNEMHRIINYYADKQLMLPKTQLRLYEFLRDYTVATEASDPSKILGCGALHIYWEDLAEIRAIAVDPEMARSGIGSYIVKQLLNEARDLEIDEIFVFTYEPKFFNKFGFVEVDHGELPLKVYNECFNCPKFNNCDEIAMVMKI
jgi:amino-acid N-acetyltransferase